MKPTATAAELYAHAIAMEREAVERYAELADRMADLDNHAVEALFRLMSVAESRHLAALLRRTDGVELPVPGAGCSWFGQHGAPETPARELVFRMMTPRDALHIALQAEQRARAFFERAVHAADDPAVRALAREMAAEEQEHVTLLERMLERTPDLHADWAALLEPR